MSGDFPMEKEEGMGGEKVCSAHSGLNARLWMLIWLIGFLIAMAGWQTTMLIDVRAQLSEQTYRFEVLGQSIAQCKKDILENRSRISILERGLR